LACPCEKIHLHRGLFVCADLQEEMHLIIWCQRNMLCCCCSSCLKLMDHSQHASKM
jgi:hypothetical protein